MSFGLSIVTPHGIAYEGEVESVVLPGSEGDFGVLAEHERFLSSLRVGEVQIQTGDRTLYAAIGEGFADVSGDQVAVLVDSFELADDIDTARAELELQRAQQDLAAANRDEDEARFAEFEAAVERARNRLAVCQRK
jgi:F-type H+-transporting ATPase subunit epsilon